ncbi:MAG: HIT family protein [Gammaproteobacteria bacterium]
MPIRLPTLMTCGFCEYIAGTRECAFVHRGPLVSTIVNHTQYESGAVLIIPNLHLSTVLDLDAAVLDAVGREAQRISRALVERFDATGINIFQNNGLDANQHYPHYHMHVVPRYPGSDPTKIYSHTNFEAISIAEQRDAAARMSPAALA